MEVIGELGLAIFGDTADSPIAHFAVKARVEVMHLTQNSQYRPAQFGLTVAKC